MTGIVGNQWLFANFAPMQDIPRPRLPHRIRRGSRGFLRTPLDELTTQIAAGAVPVQVRKVFHLDDIVEAHRVMEENRAGRKIAYSTEGQKREGVEVGAMRRQSITPLNAITTKIAVSIN